MKNNQSAETRKGSSFQDNQRKQGKPSRDWKQKRENKRQGF